MNDFDPNVTQRGRVEVRRNQGNWGSICWKKDIFWKDVFSICEKQLGFKLVSFYTPIPIFAWAHAYSGPIIYDDLFIKTKTRSWNNTDCPKQQVVHVSCDEGMTLC